MICFKERLKSLRESRGLSQDALGKILSISGDAISLYERGKREPSLDALDILADFFDCTIDYLLGRVAEPDSKIIKAPAETGAESVTVSKEHPDTLSAEEVEELKRLISKFDKIYGPHEKQSPE